MRIYRNCFLLIQRYVWIKNQAFLLVYFDFVFFKFLSLNFRWKLQPEMVQMAILKRAKLLSTTTRNCAEKKLNVFLHISISKTLVKCQLTFLMVPMATKVFAGIYYLSFSNLIVFCISFSSLNLLQTWFVQTRPDLFKLVWKYINLSKLFQTHRKLFKLVLSCSTE